MTQVIKVFTPVKRVPTMIGKAQNGQKLPFGPYTLPQVAGVAVGLIITGAGAMTLPANPAVTFLVGVALTVLVAFGLGLIPYTGVRLLSRVAWFTRLLVDPRPVLASGMPVTPESARITMFVEETVVMILPHDTPAHTGESAPAAGRGTPLFDLMRTVRSERPVPATATRSSSWRAMISGNGSGTRNGEVA